MFKRHNPQTVPKKVLKSLAPVIVKLTGDSDPEVRDASYAALGAAMKAVGEKSCMVLLADIAEDKVKIAKVCYQSSNFFQSIRVKALFYF